MPIYQVPEVSAAGLQPKYQKFTSSGTFTLPTGYGAGKPLLVNIQIIGGGGGGGGWTTNSSNWGSYTIRYNRTSYFGETMNMSLGSGTDIQGRPGGSGGIAATQMYLTSNLTITVGAAGTGGGKVQPVSNWTGNYQDNSNGSSSAVASWQNNFGGNAAWDSARSTFLTNANASGGTGGTSTAGSVSAAGGAAGTAAINIVARNTDWVNDQPSGGERYSFSRGAGAGGTPSGTAGDATPLLGTLAGGSTNTSPIFGSFGIGGKFGDNNTSTGVEGTGGGASAIGASGAVILTWWE
jgi:hypothetical protein